MKINDIENIYFLGIGGIGMSALARYFHYLGKQVYGYDKTETRLTKELTELGINITYVDDESTLKKDIDIVVYTPAIPENNKQYSYYFDNNYTLLKRSEMLGLIVNDQYNICIAGSHGKTSTSTATAYVLEQSGLDVCAFLGGISINYNSNFIYGREYAVAEADEFDRSFHRLNPDIALVTSVDTDHLDIYGSYDNIKESFKQFLENVNLKGYIIINNKVPRDILPQNRKVFTYSINDDRADFYASNISIENGRYKFSIVTHDNFEIENIELSVGGKHNVENMLGAICIAYILKVDPQKLIKHIPNYKGVKRRFEKHVETEEIVFIDDYAHHPEEINVTIDAAKELYPNKRLTTIFQPHLYSRTNDLAIEFGKALSKSDRTILLDIYPARELPIEGVTSDLILNNMNNCEVNRARKEEVLHLIKRENVEVVMTLGAGDIDTIVEPLKEYFLQ